MFFSLIFLVSSIVHANTLECVPVRNNHPLAVKDPYGEGFIFRKGGLESPFYDGKVIFTKVESRIRSFNNLSKDEKIFCDFKKGIVFCPGEKQSKAQSKNQGVTRSHRFLFKLPIKVKKKGVYELENGNPFFEKVDKFLPVELFSVFKEPSKVSGFKSGVFGYIKKSFKFWAFEEYVLAIPGSHPRGWEGISIKEFCILDLDLREMKPFTEDLSKFPKYQKR